MPAFTRQFGTPVPPTVSKSGYLLSARNVSIITATPTAGAFVGAIVTSMLGDRFGRKKTIWIGCLIAFAAMSIQTAATNVAIITVGRTLAGVSNFMFINMAISFSVELAPPSLRGAIVSLSTVSLTFAACIASAVNLGTQTIDSNLAWRIPVGIQLVGPVLIGSAILFVKESPTFFLIKSEDENARKSLAYVRHGWTDPEIDQELQNLRLQHALRATEVQVSWRDIFKGTDLRRTVLATFFSVALQVSGLAYAGQYARIFFTQIGNATPLLMVFALCLLEGGIVGQFLIEILGRRKQAIIFTTLIACIDLIVGCLGFAPATNKSASTTIAGFSLLFGFCITAGMNPLSYTSLGEFPTARLRNKTGAFALLSANLSILAVSYVLPYIVNPDAADLGAKVFLVFAGFMFLAAIYCYFCFPEIRGRTAAELDELFENKVPASKFKSYLCATAMENTPAEGINESAKDVVVHEVEHRS
ncbi:hypothetical protein LTS07_008525 [Exophiala sideris]|uniref:Major facilitator superfamily (MFS) profile domain-containing protein n=1 Tax=Exophiala sideris TaxID=1016849 RepID=A0ABR0J260_9EURO|nr:hypothetical protein LTS07_008525 [Exophiala sideris]KAK5030772.1 hypothetical protein LTR13_008126 [Exophiala sideris]KAK5054313.1 hypothetical protein LTR69_008928 [Exophiala sideris]KAK5179715.1 hypothetical protein LTR44_007883 [Eurotiomycetes sp. CCFEE 6388]